MPASSTTEVQRHQPDRPGSPGFQRIQGAGWVVPAVCSVLAVLAMDPRLWLDPSIPALTDLPGHLLPPTLLREELIPRGRLQGWSFDWFAGFPVYRFYFPLPGVMVALLGGLLGDAVALRVVAGLPLVLLPWALWFFGRSAGLDPLRSVGVTVIGSSSVLMTTHGVLGGNILSVAAGEFSYAWSLVFLIPFLGLVAGPHDSPGRRVRAGVVLAAAVLCHVVPVIPVALAAGIFLADRRLRPRIVWCGVVAAGLSSFWVLPMATSLDEVASRNWAFVPSWSDAVPLELLLLAVPAAYGLTLLGRQPALRLLAVAGAMALLLAVVPQGLVMRGRPLPVWFLVVHALAGAGLAHAVIRTVERRGRSVVGPAFVAVAGGTCWMAVVLIRGVPQEAVAPVLAGLPERPGNGVLTAIVDDMDRLPPGRVHWEAGPELKEYGGPFALALLPYWTAHTTLSGLWAESAPLSEILSVVDSELSPEPIEMVAPRSVPALPWNPRRGVLRLRTLGVRYYLTHSPATSAAVEEEVGPAVASRGPLRLFDLGPTPLAVPLTCWRPYPDGISRRASQIRWTVDWSPGEPHLVDGDLSSGEEGGRGAECREAPLATGGVDAALSGVDGIILRTSHPGVPHLLRASWSARWRATGGDGPYLASPGFMVVVPREGVVTLEYVASPWDWAGRVVSVGSIVLLGLFGVRRRRVNGGAATGPIRSG